VSFVVGCGVVGAVGAVGAVVMEKSCDRRICNMQYAATSMKNTQ